MIGCRTRRFDACVSTNDLAAAWAKDPHDRAPDGGVVVADSQTGGRGRLGKDWHSPPGENLYFSCVLRPDLAAEKVPPITLCAGLALCEVMNSLGVKASIKWPNDVWVGQRKLAGVLTEMSTQSQKVESVIVGVGVNVNATEFPVGLQATSVRIETGKDHERSGLLDVILSSMDEWVERYTSGGVAALARAFEKHNLLGGRQVQVRIAGAMVSGRVASLADDGSLLLTDQTGATHKVIAGEVNLLPEDNNSQVGART